MLVSRLCRTNGGQSVAHDPGIYLNRSLRSPAGPSTSACPTFFLFDAAIFGGREIETFFPRVGLHQPYPFTLLRSLAETNLVNLAFRGMPNLRLAGWSPTTAALWRRA